MRFFSKQTLIYLTIGIALLLISGNSLAQSASQPSELNAIYACKTVASPTERLACYDEAVGNFQEAEKSGEVVTISKTEVKKVEQEAFGFNIPSLPKIGKILGLGNSSGKEKKPKKEVLTAQPVADQGGPIQRVEYNNDNSIESITMEIDRVTTFDSIKKRFFFKNGQVWEQTTGATVKLPKGSGPMTASISKGTLGGYKLKLNDKGWKVKVRRVR